LIWFHLVQRRTALINEIRGFLLERGITFRADPIHLRKNLPTVIEDATENLSPRLRWLLERLWQEWQQMEIDLKTITDALERISNEDALCGVCVRSPASAHSFPRPRWRLSATALLFVADATSPPGWESCHGSTRREAEHSCSVSVSGAMCICGAC
jgi:hypothetical protein